MVSFEKDRQHNVTLARFSGEFGPETIVQLDHASELLVEAEGPTHFVLDFSGIERVNMPDRAIAKRGQRVPLCIDYERVVVAPQPELFGLYRVFAAAAGAAAPVIVRSISEALLYLDLRRPVFEPVDMAADRGAGPGSDVGPIEALSAGPTHARRFGIVYSRKPKVWDTSLESHGLCFQLLGPADELLDLGQKALLIIGIGDAFGLPLGTPRQIARRLRLQQQRLLFNACHWPVSSHGRSRSVTSRKLTSRPLASSHKASHGARSPRSRLSGSTGQIRWTASCAVASR
jgi:hypothetical protein